MTAPRRVPPWKQRPPYGVEFDHDGTILINGWSVPLVTGKQQPDGSYAFIVDGRMGFDIPEDAGPQAAILVASCVAIGLGLTHFPQANESSPYDGDAEQEKRWRDLREELLKLHPALRPSFRVCVGWVETAPLGPQKIEPSALSSGAEKGEKP